MKLEMERRRTTVALVVACAGLAACAYQPTIRHPTPSSVRTDTVPDRAALDERTALLDALREPMPAATTPGP